MLPVDSDLADDGAVRIRAAVAFFVVVEAHLADTRGAAALENIVTMDMAREKREQKRGRNVERDAK